MADWRLYLLRCGDDSYYAGVTTDMARRLRQHQRGKGARYTRSHLPVTLLGVSTPLSRQLAHQLERRIKRLSRPRKRSMLAAMLDVTLTRQLQEAPTDGESTTNRGNASHRPD